MNDGPIPQILADFLTAYLAVESDLSRAVRAFAARESKAAVQNLAAAVRELLAKDLPPVALTREIEALSNSALSPNSTARDRLLELFAALVRRSGPLQRVRAYDAFISYSSKDAPLASWLASQLRTAGYSVWLDSDEILVGHSILDEVYRGIRESEFLIVLLTKQSVRSRWVREELTAGKLRELEHDRVVVLPVRCEPDVDIPEVLRSKRWADMSESREQGLAEILRAIDVHRSQPALTTTGPTGPANHTRLLTWSEQIESHLEEYGFDRTKGGFKDILVGPADGEEAQLNRNQLLDLLEKTRVRIRGWGGPPFPYEARQAEVINVDDGVSLIDKHTWPYSEWNFYYWRMTTSAQFFQRSGLNEDGDTGPDRVVRLRGSLYVVWVLKDICSALMFASRLLREVPTLQRLVVIHRLVGMDGRRLVSRRLSEWGGDSDLVGHQDRIEKEATITRDTDLEGQALQLALDAFWLFNWRNPSEDLLLRDIRSFIGGTFPTPGW